nr:uncharacterized protein LOC110090901 [Pogona vitticeps]
MDKFKHCQFFHPELFNIVLSVLVPNEPQELSCAPNKFSGADELRSAILALVLSKNQGIISVGALHIRISIEANPTVVFGPNGIVITATLKVEFFIRNADGSTYFVLVVRSRVTLSAVLSFVKGRLIFVASVTGNALELISSDAGVSDDVSSLEPHCANLLGETFLLVFNVIISAMLHDGLLLNHLKGISLSDVNFGELLDQANSITGLRIGNLEVTSYEGALVPSGLDVCLSVCLNITGHTLLDPSNLVSLSLEVTFRVKYERTNFQNGSLDIIFHECGANFGAITTTLLGSTLSASLLDKIQDSIIADINLQICGVLKTVIHLAKDFLFNSINGGTTAPECLG